MINSLRVLRPENVNSFGVIVVATRQRPDDVFHGADELRVCGDIGRFPEPRRGRRGLRGLSRPIRVLELDRLSDLVELQREREEQ